MAGSRVLPVQAEPEANHPLLRSFQHADMTRDADSARRKLAAELLRVDAAGGLGWPDDRSPFPGLRALNTDEHPIFFGRGHEVARLATLLRSPAEQAERAALLVVGPSGCGKSSLVRAGLLPVMAAEPDWWTLPALLPGTQPVAALARELAASGHRLGLPWTATDVRRDLDDDGLTGLVDDLLLAVPGRRRRHLLIVVAEDWRRVLVVSRNTGAVSVPNGRILAPWPRFHPTTCATARSHVRGRRGRRGRPSGSRNAVTVGPSSGRRSPSRAAPA